MKIRRYYLLILFLIMSCYQNKYEYYHTNEGEILRASYKINRFTKKVEGTSVHFDMKGDTTMITEFKSGKAHGKAISFHSNGEVHTIDFYNNGVQTGVCKEFYQNGNIRSIVEYNEDKLWNIIEIRDVNKSKLDYGDLKDGNGLVKKYDEYGNLAEYGNIRNGLREGEWTYFTNTGYKSTKEFKKGYPENYNYQVILY